MFLGGAYGWLAGGKEQGTETTRDRKKGTQGRACPRLQGSWKIAYADFVTALMAFFPLMWLISAVSRQDLRAIAEYFKTPLFVALAGGTSETVSASLISSDYGDDLTKESRQVKAGT